MATYISGSGSSNLILIDHITYELSKNLYDQKIEIKNDDPTWISNNGEMIG